MTPEEQIERAEQARAFREYTESNPYFNSMLDEARAEITKSIMALSPADTVRFIILRAQYDAIGFLNHIVGNDIFFGTKALEKLQGVEQQEGGIL